jgi:hypothetical protein
MACREVLGFQQLKPPVMLARRIFATTGVNWADHHVLYRQKG